jgi:Fic family protein
MSKPSDLLGRIDERQQAMEKSFMVHQDYTKQMLDTLSHDLREVMSLQKIANGRTSKLEGITTNLSTVTADLSVRVPFLERWRSKLNGVWLAVTIAGLTLSFIGGCLVTWYAVQR